MNTYVIFTTAGDEIVVDAEKATSTSTEVTFTSEGRVVGVFSYNHVVGYVEEDSLSLEVEDDLDDEQ